ncbi:MAG: riboflavin biosynthesis protein RibF [Clostridia bacterium]|nr:riboflavin biosynthesis protein RibF [Clostridia bacterium]
MKIYDYTPGTRISGKRVIALGFFDGVHKGHRAIIDAAIKIAKEKSLPAALFTFRAENAELKNNVRIYSTEKKLSILESLGIDEVIIADFSKLKGLSAERFITDTLLGDFGCAAAVSGEDFRFGKMAVGDTALLREKLSHLGAELICPGAIYENGEKISSTRIKSLLTEGRVWEAAELLGEPYFIYSEVKRGLGKGKTFGFPTVNTEIDDGEVSLLSGVYKCRVKIDGHCYDAISNVGVCPTVGERKKHTETYILNYSGELYGESIRIEFLNFIRPEKKFDSEKDLIMQIKLDISKNFDSEDIII